jgi:hypothetical protein
MVPDTSAARTEPRPSLRLTPPALTPAGPRRRSPGPLAVRRHYRLARWASVAVGGLAAAAVIAAGLADLAARKLVPDQTFYVFSLLVLAVGLGLPWLVAKLLWRWKWRWRGWGP